MREEQNEDDQTSQAVRRREEEVLGCTWIMLEPTQLGQHEFAQGFVGEATLDLIPDDPCACRVIAATPDQDVGT